MLGRAFAAGARRCRWTRQSCRFALQAGRDLELCCQKLVNVCPRLFRAVVPGGELPRAPKLAGAEVVRLGRSRDAGSTLGSGAWRSLRGAP